jgi:hypothetical protein
VLPFRWCAFLSTTGYPSRGLQGLLSGLNERTMSPSRRHRIQIVMDATGDTRHEFDVDDDAAGAEAKRRFEELTEAGFIVAKRTGNGTSELIRRFDPDSQETLFIPRLVGGWSWF